MTDLLVLAAFLLSFTAFVRTRRSGERLEKELAALKAEVARLSLAREAVAPAEAATMVETRPDPEPEAPVDDVVAPAAEILETTAGPEAPRDAAPAEAGSPAPETAPARETFESLLGGRWAVWVGGIALALGGVFLVKVSIDAGLLSPAVRLALAALFGLALLAAGEGVRRRPLPGQGGRFGNAMIPGILTAAGAVTLFGAIFAAHAVYDVIGPAIAFAGLVLVSFAVLALALVHGQALGGLGLAASMITPLLVSSDDPGPWTLFGFLTLAWLAALVAARLGRWRVVPAMANLGLALWAVFYLIAVVPAVTLPVTLSMLVLVAGLGLVWPASLDDASLPLPDEAGEGAGRRARWRRLLLPHHASVVLSGAFAVFITGLSLVSPLTEPAGDPTWEFVALTAALALLGALRPGAVTAAIVAGCTAILGVATLFTLSDLVDVAGSGFATARPFAGASMAPFALAGLFIAAAAVALHRHGHRPAFASFWAGIAAVTSAACLALSFLMVGTFAVDLPHGLAALIAAAGLLFLAERLSRHEKCDVAQGLLLAGVVAHAAIAAHALSDGLATVLAMAVVAGAFVAAMRLRPWKALPWAAVLGFLAVLVRIGWEPTIVGPLALGRTPVFNALLPGYGIPALLALWSAYTLRDWPSARLRNVLQAVASLFALLTLAILVRHALNGGQLEGGLPSLSEQSIYTLLVIGGSAILLRLDLSRPGSFLRYGGMGLGVLSMLMVLSAHLGGLNPYFTGERLGPYPVVDLLLIGYLLPGLAYAAIARMAAGRRPRAYVAVLAGAAAVLVFAWATLSVRRFWQGDSIADWKGFLPGETYTYSVVWLALGVLLLVAGLRLHARSLRIASAILVFVTVTKVFLVDMANLEGLLRALSFIGLGGVLIGIGLFYQKVLTRKPE